MSLFGDFEAVSQQYPQFTRAKNAELMVFRLCLNASL